MGHQQNREKLDLSTERNQPIIFEPGSHSLVEGTRVIGRCSLLGRKNRYLGSWLYHSGNDQEKTNILWEGRCGRDEESFETDGKSNRR